MIYLNLMILEDIEFVLENKVPDSSTYDYKSFNEAMSEYKEEENEYNERHNINPKDYENIHYEDNYISTPSKSDNKNNLNQNNFYTKNRYHIIFFQSAFQ